MAFFNSAVGVLQTLVVALGTGPGIDFDIINKLANGTEVPVTKEENGWYQLEFPAKYGYVCGQYLELNDITPEETPESYTFDIDGEMMASNQIISMTAEDILRVADGTSLYEQGGENMPENARYNVQVPDFVLEAEAQMAKEGKTAEASVKREEVTIKFGKGLAEPFQSKDGREFMRIMIPNQELKSMVEAYKTRAPQARESARKKLDALVKDTASKLTPEKTPKAKSKTKKGPEL